MTSLCLPPQNTAESGPDTVTRPKGCRVGATIDGSAAVKIGMHSLSRFVEILSAATSMPPRSLPEDSVCRFVVDIGSRGNPDVTCSTPNCEYGDPDVEITLRMSTTAPQQSD